MATVLYRSDSPYIPRPIERPQRMLMTPASSEPKRGRRILVASCRSDPLIATDGMFVSELSQALADLGHDVDVASGPPYPELDDRAHLIELPAASPRSGRSPLDLLERFRGAFGETTDSSLFGRRLVRHVQERSNGYDLVIDNQSLCLGLLKLQRMGITVISMVHDMEALQGPAQRNVLRRADKILVSTPFAFEVLGETPEIDRRKLVLVPRGAGSRGQRAAAALETIYADLPGNA